VATLERQGRLSRAEAAVHPQRNILTRALGIDANVMVDSWEILPVIGDRYLICSDGLFNEVDDNRLAATLRRLADPSEAASELVRLANEAGGRDNITCVVVDVVDDSGRDPAATSSSDRITAHTTGGDAALFGTAAEGDEAAEGSKVGRRQRRREARAAEGRPRRRVLTWRVGLFVLAFLAIVGITIGVIVYMGRNTYYVGVQDQQVVIFRGRPGGVAWIEPELAEPTSIPLSEVPAARVDEVQAGVEESSLEGARRYVANLQEQIDAATTTTTTSTTTTTVLPAAAPVTVVPG
jgi:protein phosphatase